MSKTAKWIITVLVIILVVAGIWYSQVKSSAPVDTGPIKIGVIAPLTGDVAIWGQSGLAGITLATNEINDNGGINGRKVELVIEDDKASPENSATAANKLISIDKVSALIISSASGATSAAVPIAQNNKIPSMVTIASAPSITAVGNYIFRSAPPDSSQGNFAADFIFDKMGKKNVAILWVTNAWGTGIDGVFKKEFLAKGGKITYESGVLETDVDLKGALLKVKNSGAEALYFPVYPASALAGFKQAKELKLDIPIICGDAIDGNDVLKNPVAEGIMYTLAKIGSPEDFLKKINGLGGFENLKPNIAGSMSYDGAKILFLAIEKARTTDSSRVIEKLVKTSYAGISSPIIEFDENREVKNPVFNVKIIKNGAVVDYSS